MTQPIDLHSKCRASKAKLAADNAAMLEALDDFQKRLVANVWHLPPEYSARHEVLAVAQDIRAVIARVKGE